ncbi:hydroxymethylpyrimidine/phosphomethylpyrimidine kinase [Candidatus Brocadiaceae bacterium]|nr:hydroxymethylpyrimidine/phosphomethylpyrimidine kinase [Candidatus Brocadiaceae bacterium]
MKPIVLTFSGHDPCGGAGVQADIEAIISQDCHASSVITCLTEQNTHNVKKLLPQSPDEFLSQTQTLLTDIHIHAIKIGLIGDAEIALVIKTILKNYSTIPIILDPILAAGGGKELANQSLLTAILELLPYITLLTPNSVEARKLTGLNDLTACGWRLLELGCKAVLITGTHENTDDVSNSLFYQGQMKTYHYPRLPHTYHGSGCTLAASIAAFLAQNMELTEAVLKAQDYTWQSLKTAYTTGKGQHNPARLFWTKQ